MGVYQGSVLSPFIFAVVEDVVTEFAREGVLSEFYFFEILQDIQFSPLFLLGLFYVLKVITVCVSFINKKCCCHQTVYLVVARWL